MEKTMTWEKTMLNFAQFVVVLLLAASNALAGQVPGTSVSLTPPTGFIAADRFPGFMNESSGASIMVSEIPGPYAEVTAGFSNKQQLQARGMTLLAHSAIKVDGQQAMLVNVEQSAYGTLFRKWMLVIDRPGATVLIAASFPKTESAQGEALKAAILSVTFGKPGDPADALAFVATPMAPFAVAKIMGQNMILSLEGRFPVKDESDPLMVIGLSASKDLAIPDRKGFAEQRVTHTATVSKVSIDQTVPITIGRLSGYETMANGVNSVSAMPLTIYQILLFDKSGYTVIQGITPTAQKDKYMPLFRQIANTFKLK